MFEAISKRFTQIAGRVWRRRRITEANIDEALREIRTALLSADVAVSVVKTFLDGVKEEALGFQITKGVTSGQEFVYTVYHKLIELMGGALREEGAEPEVSVARAERGPTVILMVGLQGAGKTTTTAKLARRLGRGGRTPMLAACDLQRPAAIEQLQTLGSI